GRMGKGVPGCKVVDGENHVAHEVPAEIPRPGRPPPPPPGENGAALRVQVTAARNSAGNIGSAIFLDWKILAARRPRQPSTWCPGPAGRRAARRRSRAPMRASAMRARPRRRDCDSPLEEPQQDARAPKVLADEKKRTKSHCQWTSGMVCDTRRS